MSELQKKNKKVKTLESTIHFSFSVAISPGLLSAAEIQHHAIALRMISSTKFHVYYRLISLAEKARPPSKGDLLQIVALVLVSSDLLKK